MHKKCRAVFHSTHYMGSLSRSTASHAATVERWFSRPPFNEVPIPFYVTGKRRELEIEQCFVGM